MANRPSEAPFGSPGGPRTVRHLDESGEVDRELPWNPPWLNEVSEVCAALYFAASYFAM